MQLLYFMIEGQHLKVKLNLLFFFTQYLPSFAVFFFFFLKIKLSPLNSALDKCIPKKRQMQGAPSSKIPNSLKRANFPSAKCSLIGVAVEEGGSG